MICPLLAIASSSANPQGDSLCLKEKCAWWIERKEDSISQTIVSAGCVIVKIAKRT